MQTKTERNLFVKILQWFDPRSRQIGTWAFILNRITALGLTLYLFLHLIILGYLAQGPNAYDAFINFAKNPIVILGELLVVVGGIIHGLNGIRIGLTSFGIGNAYQKNLFIGLMIIALIISVVFAVRMLTA